MRFRLKRGVGVALLAAALLIPAPAALAKGGEIELIKGEVATVVKGTDAWVALTFTAKKGEIEDVRMTVDSKTRGVTVSYPENTGDHTSLWDNDSLKEGEIDFAAFHVDVAEDVRGKSAKLRINVEMTVEGKRERDKFDVKVPLVDYTGGNVQQVTDSVGSITVGEARWVEVAFTGLAPVTKNVTTVVSASGLSIIYPGEGARTSLHHDAELDSGETDVIRFYVDAGSAEPGTYTIQLDTVFDGGSLPGTVTLDVMPSA